MMVNVSRKMLTFLTSLKQAIQVLVLFCCLFPVLFVVYCYIYNMATKHTIVEEDLLLSGDSTVEYGGSLEYESDYSTDEYPNSIASRSTGDSIDSDGSSLEGSGDEEVIEIDGDDGNFASDIWRFMLALLELLAIRRIVQPEEYVRVFLGELIFVDTNHYAWAKIAARESARPDKIHRPCLDVTLVLW